MPLIEHAIILAAGRGARMMPLTSYVPKPMVKVGEKTLIERGIGQIKKYVPRVHVTVGYKADLLASHVVPLGVDSVFNTAGQGNAWWIFQTLMRHLDAPVFVLTCDNVTDIDLDHVARDYFDLGAPPCMVVPVKPVEGLEGDYIFHRNQVVHDLRRDVPAETYCSGIQVLNPSAVRRITGDQEDFGTVWKLLMQEQRLLCGKVEPRRWFVFDTPAQLDAYSEAAQTELETLIAA